MRIEDIKSEVDPSINNRTKCTKMTDEIKNGINGDPAIHINRENVLNAGGIYGGGNGLQSVTASINFKEERDDNRLQDNKGNKFNNEINNGSSDLRLPHHQGTGGRLQFFKDGKFILELARAREGEKGGWVSVPRKTYWPPSASATNVTNYTKNESSASLISDDNSSIQSSPWQRDHCWKQATPKKGISKEMCMMFKRVKNLKISRNGHKIARIKRRRPYDVSMSKMPFIYVENGFISRYGDDSTDGTAKQIKKEPDDEPNDNNTENQIDCRNKKTVDEKKCKPQIKLTAILQKLIDRLPTGVFTLPKTTHVSGTINHFPSSTSSRIAELHHHQHVSPRKRILRELEKVTLEDNKRSRAKAGSTTALSPLITTSVSMCQNAYKTTNSNTQVSNENSNDQNVTSVSNSTRLYSSYSIHSLLGHTNNNNNSNHHKTESNLTSSSKEINNDLSYLRNVLSSPKSPENGSQMTTSPSIVNSKKKSPTYASLQDAHRHNRSPSEALVNYGRVRSPEMNRSPDNNLNSRYKQFGSSITSNTTASGFHPYLASPKYSSSSNLSPNPSTESYKMKAICTSNSPNHSRNSGCSRSPSAFSPSSQNKMSSFHSPTSTSNNSNRLREPSPSEVTSPGLERREAIPRTVPKKTVALRQQFTSPVSSPSVTQGESSSSSTYKSGSGVDHKRKNNIEERTISPENAIYHSGVDMEHVTAGVLRSSPVLPHSSLFYLYPPHGSTGSHSAAAAAAAAAAASSYIPPVSYYHPYAAAVAALRNPLWMHYQAGVMSSVQPRLPAIFPYNGATGAASAASVSQSLASMHLPPAGINPWSPLNRESSSTDDSVSLVSIKDEHSSDVPLNLSKH